MASDPDKVLHQVDTGKVASGFSRTGQGRGHPLVVVAQFMEHAPVTLRAHVSEADHVWSTEVMSHEGVSGVHPSRGDLGIEYSPLDPRPWEESIQLVLHLKSLIPPIHEVVRIL